MDDFKKALDATGLVVPMATTNLFRDPVFRDGAYTASDPKVRAYALQKTMRAIDLGVELGATTYVFWGGREGVETDAAKDPLRALGWYADAINFLCAYVKDQGYDLRFALEPKPNEPRGDIYLPTTGAMLAFIATLEHGEMVGVNPEVAHEHMAGLNSTHHVAQAWSMGKLFHIDLNDQIPGRYDQDLRFGSGNPKAAFFLVKFLEDVGYTGSRHFDAHAYRTSDYEDVKAFARGCMRTYLILKEKAERWNADPDIQALVAAASADDGSMAPYLSGYTAEARRRVGGDRVRPERPGRSWPAVRGARSADDRSAARRSVTLEVVAFAGHGCVRLASGAGAAIVSTSVGPRIIGLFRSGDEDNVLAVLPDAAIDRAGGPPYRLLGGHRLWAAPEVPGITYQPDDRPCAVTEVDDGVRVEAPADGAGLIKSIEVRRSDDGWTVDHSVRNGSGTTVTLAPWAITQLPLGGRMLVPSSTDATGPQADRALVLWPYTDPADARLRLTADMVVVDAVASGSRLKVGVAPSSGRASYERNGTVLEKHVDVHADALVRGSRRGDPGVPQRRVLRARDARSAARGPARRRGGPPRALDRPARSGRAMSHVLGLDVSTTATKAVLLDAEGTVHAASSSRVHVRDAAAAVERTGSTALVGRNDHRDPRVRSPRRGSKGTTSRRWGSRDRCTASSRSIGTTTSCVPRSSGTTSGPRRSATRSGRRSDAIA